jgi:hypothetical protein
MEKHSVYYDHPDFLEQAFARNLNDQEDAASLLVALAVVFEKSDKQIVTDGLIDARRSRH